ncbi:hypothetical protein COCMIDRAFT_6800 [Bipolaris oryzae ATCC 44560]|uniref:Uncharacterized protein n=1 Tax=Bipolaris oryzae ATCC 44560 TaxID=930090 RepID=W6YWM8_COCMI|nr:uncharacterized protein COCMIDRAFT_6800 [Bipolaris oryzae ATCC 44560]EUC43777.1 hypothetical protein COCMIDRAFT_6800 [Bipolaris oryzae ATCC 44560]
MVATRAAKRRRLAENARAVAASTSDEPQNTFLKLPQEIREQIYTFIFEDNGMEFRWKAILLLCASSPMLHWGSYDLDGPRGLPSWILTCKQTLHEVVEFIARTHTIRVVQKIGWPERAMDEAPNPLVISNNGIRNIYLSRTEGWLDVSWLRGSCGLAIWRPLRKHYFLSALKDLRLTDVCLELCWGRWVENPIQASSWRGGERIGFLADWTPYREGRFQKVTIDVTVCYGTEQGSPNQQLMREAKKLAVQLVGSGGVVTWCDYDGIGDTSLIRKCVVVERKI